MSVKIIYFVHGTTYDNENGKCSGWKQAKLSDLGREQALELGQIINYKFDIIFTSDLTRAVESANIAFPSYKSKADSRLRECNYGDFDGEDKKLVVYDEHINNPFPNGESLMDVEIRIRSFAGFLKEKYDGKIVGIVAHRAPQLALEVITKTFP